MKKKLLYTFIALAMLALLSAQGMYYILFDLAQVHCKTVSRESISADKGLGVVTVALETFSHRPDEKEIWVNGSLYDIGTYRVSGDIVRITVYHDKTEELLVAGITAIFEVTGANYYDLRGHHISKVHSNGFNDAKILPRPYDNSPAIPLSARLDAPDHFFFNLLQAYSSIIKPPPKGVIIA